MSRKCRPYHPKEPNMSDHKNQQIVQVWMPRDLVRQLDAHLASQVAHLSGAKPSRQGFLMSLVRRALDEARPVAGPAKVQP